MTEPGTLVRNVDYRRLAIQQQTVEGRLALASLPRTAATTEGDASVPVTVALTFFEDSQRRVRMEGRITTTLGLRCQRCLRVFEQPMDVTAAGVVVSDDTAAAEVPRSDEPILADGGQLDIYAVIDDELLLALPVAARCQYDECTARYDKTSPAENGSERPNPFAVLQSLKDD